MLYLQSNDATCTNKGSIFYRSQLVISEIYFLQIFKFLESHCVCYHLYVVVA